MLVVITSKRQNFLKNSFHNKYNFSTKHVLGCYMSAPALTIKQRLTNYYYFVIFCSLLACVIGMGYWYHQQLNPLNFNAPSSNLTALEIVFLICSHFSIITFSIFALGLVILPTVFLSFKKSLIIQIILFSFVFGLLICDVRVYQSDAVHLSQIAVIVKDILTSKEAMFTLNKAIACSLIIVFMWLMYKTNQWINKTTWLTNNKIATKFSMLVMASAIISLLSYQLTSKQRQQNMLFYAQYLLPDINTNKQIKNTYKQIKYGKIQYPLKPLQTTAVTPPQYFNYRYGRLAS